MGESVGVEVGVDVLDMMVVVQVEVVIPLFRGRQVKDEHVFRSIWLCVRRESSRSRVPRDCSELRLRRFFSFLSSSCHASHALLILSLVAPHSIVLV